MKVRWAAHRRKGSHGLLHYGPNVTTVRNLKDEIDNVTFHKMLKQLGLLREGLRVRETTVRTFVYPARVERGDKSGVPLISFRDVSDAITQGKGERDALLAGRGFPGRGDCRQNRMADS